MRFFVGQRVRITEAAKSPRCGCAATVVRIVECDLRGNGWGLNYQCTVDGWPEPTDAVGYGYREWMLEPIIPSGHKPADKSFSEMMGELRSGVVA